MAAPAIDDQISSGGLAYIVTARLGDFWGRVFLLDVVLAAFVCTLAIQTATTRMIYSMSRDEVLPFSRHLRKVSPRGGATVHAAVLVLVGLVVRDVWHPELDRVRRSWPGTDDPAGGVLDGALDRVVLRKRAAEQRDLSAVGSGVTGGLQDDGAPGGPRHLEQ